ncbi:YesK family protein [Bacillus amyloliquefaciens]|uniref:YesK family protein n=1 Tax=Bacillus amyloliquefaciens TaxID=1390 RepID=UPI0005EDDABF|nr:YesK family protein [Bacillus amyloliquefaciens]
MWYFYLFCLAGFCLNFGISAFLRKKWPKKMWPECLLAVIGLAAFGTVVYSMVGVGGWEGMGLGLAAMFAGFGAAAGYAAEACVRVIRLNKNIKQK